jgi:NAD(P)-dependent dehydrogenase (short-subunit alcohol dehydrogenase family)
MWAVLFTLSSAVVNALPLDPTGPLPRDLPNAILTDRMQDYFHGNWTGYALMVLNAFAAPIAEELVFRGLLLPRTRAVFGRANIVANSAMFTLFHLHQPWSMPATFIDGALNQAFPTQRFGSTWMGIVTHSAPSFLVCGVLLAQVLRTQGHGVIVALSSVAGEKVRRTNFVYGSSKAGMDGFYLGLGEALRGTGARVSVIRPGHVRTKMTAGRDDAPLAVDAPEVAAAIVRAVEREEDLVWVPRAMRGVMSALRHVPRPVFRRLPI